MAVINRPIYSSRFRVRSRMKTMLRKSGRFCAYCRNEMTKDFGHNHPRAPSRDHIVPLSRGGRDAFDNITLSCRGCNEAKGSLDGEEFRAWLDGRASRLDQDYKHNWNPRCHGTRTLSCSRRVGENFQHGNGGMRVVADRSAGGRMLISVDEAGKIFHRCNAALKSPAEPNTEAMPQRIRQG